MSRDEMDLNHPTAAGVSDHWHKLLFFAMVKNNIEEVVITSDDLAKADFETKNVLCVEESPDGLHIKRITEKEAIKIYNINKTL